MGRGVVGLIGTVITLGVVVAGFVIITGFANKKRQQKITSFVGFDPNYYVKAGQTLGHERAKILADQIYDAIGYFNDNEEQVLGVLREVGTAGNLSLVSHYFQIRHGENMGGFISDYLNRKQETKVVLDALKNIKIKG